MGPVCALSVLSGAGEELTLASSSDPQPLRPRMRQDSHGTQHALPRPQPHAALPLGPPFSLVIVCGVRAEVRPHGARDNERKLRGEGPPLPHLVRGPFFSSKYPKRESPLHAKGQCVTGVSPPTAVHTRK